MIFSEFVERLKVWSANESGIEAVAIVGSHARGAARPDSDIDVIIICGSDARLLDDATWLKYFGPVKSTSRENWGLVQSWRTFYEDDSEVEFNITTKEWCSQKEIPGGTGRVIRDGVLILFDPLLLLHNLVRSLAEAK